MHLVINNEEPTCVERQDVQHICKDCVIEQRAGGKENARSPKPRVAAKLFQDIWSDNETILRTSHVRMEAVMLLGRSTGDGTLSPCRNDADIGA